jgi:hypothetical protein
MALATESGLQTFPELESAAVRTDTYPHDLSLYTLRWRSPPTARPSTAVPPPPMQSLLKSKKSKEKLTAWLGTNAQLPSWFPSRRHETHWRHCSRRLEVQTRTTSAAERQRRNVAPKACLGELVRRRGAAVRTVYCARIREARARDVLNLAVAIGVCCKSRRGQSPRTSLAGAINEGR